MHVKVENVIAINGNRIYIEYDKHKKGNYIFIKIHIQFSILFESVIKAKYNFF